MTNPLKCAPFFHLLPRKCSEQFQSFLSLCERSQKMLYVFCSMCNLFLSLFIIILSYSLRQMSDSITNEETPSSPTSVAQIEEETPPPVLPNPRISAVPMSSIEKPMLQTMMQQTRMSFQLGGDFQFLFPIDLGGANPETNIHSGIFVEKKTDSNTVGEVKPYHTLYVASPPEDKPFHSIQEEPFEAFYLIIKEVQEATNRAKQEENPDFPPLETSLETFAQGFVKTVEQQSGAVVECSGSRPTTPWYGIYLAKDYITVYVFDEDVKPLFNEPEGNLPPMRFIDLETPVRHRHCTKIRRFLPPDEWLLH